MFVSCFISQFEENTCVFFKTVFLTNRLPIMVRIDCSGVTCRCVSFITKQNNREPSQNDIFKSPTFHKYFLNIISDC